MIFFCLLKFLSTIILSIYAQNKSHFNHINVYAKAFLLLINIYVSFVSILLNFTHLRLRSIKLILTAGDIPPNFHFSAFLQTSTLKAERRV